MQTSLTITRIPVLALKHAQSFILAADTKISGTWPVAESNVSPERDTDRASGSGASVESVHMNPAETGLSALSALTHRDIFGYMQGCRVLVLGQLSIGDVFLIAFV